MLALAFLGLLPAAAPAAAAEPRDHGGDAAPGDRVEEIAAAVPGIAPGVMSAGLGRVPAGQTYLDIGQGNRIFTSLYPEPLPPLYVTGNRVPADLWARVVVRADGAPADIEPGPAGDDARGGRNRDLRPPARRLAGVDRRRPPTG